MNSNQLCQILKNAENQLKLAPDGTISTSTCKGCVQFYIIKGTNSKSYLSRKDETHHLKKIEKSCFLD